MRKIPLLIIDFGSQYTQLIARRVRELAIYCEIVPCSTSVSQILSHEPQALILSGGPSSAYGENAPTFDLTPFIGKIPVLGICYGMQLIQHQLGGRVERSAAGEYGLAEINIQDPAELFVGIPLRFKTWMSHGDRVTQVAAESDVLAVSTHSPVAAMAHRWKKLYGLQFHPEVTHTEYGKEILKNFLLRVAGIIPQWTVSSQMETIVSTLRKRLRGEKVLVGVSGGIDSTVTTLLLHRALGQSVHPIFVDTGLLRHGEVEEVLSMFQNYFRIPLKIVHARERFFAALSGVTDPEIKRKKIGNLFIRIFEEEASARKIQFLAQGTLYPDVIESLSPKGGPSATIKTHHNVGGLPADMKLQLVEPLRELFKDEVRSLARKLEVPERFLNRHPFPGPGLAVRVLGEVTSGSVALLQQADRIFIEELKRHCHPESSCHSERSEESLYDKIWQAFAVLLPVRSVGVMGDGRTYEKVIALRAVTSEDGMTAQWYPLSHAFLSVVSRRIINEVSGVNRVVYDISSKPPSTIEWE